MAGMHNMLMGVGEAVLDLQTVTAKFISATGGDPKSPETVNYYGYGNFVTGSTISDGTSAMFADVSILSLYWDTYFNGVTFAIDSDVANSGFSKMRVVHTHTGTVTTFNRASATFLPFSTGVSERTQWVWSSSNIFSNVTTGQNTYLVYFLG